MAEPNAALMSAGPALISPRPAGFTGPERRNWILREQLVRRVRAEFDEMPGLRLTFAQARLLFGLEATCCRRILTGLAAEGFLVRTGGGLYGRRDLLG